MMTRTVTLYLTILFLLLSLHMASAIAKPDDVWVLQSVNVDSNPKHKDSPSLSFDEMMVDSPQVRFVFPRTDAKAPAWRSDQHFGIHRHGFFEEVETGGILRGVGDRHRDLTCAFQGDPCNRRPAWLSENDPPPQLRDDDPGQVNADPAEIKQGFHLRKLRKQQFQSSIEEFDFSGIVFDT